MSKRTKKLLFWLLVVPGALLLLALTAFVSGG